MDVAYIDPTPPISEAAGCRDVETIDLRRPLEREVGEAGDPEPGAFESEPRFYRVQQPERVPLPGSSTIPGLRLSMTTRPKVRAGAPLEITTRWSNEGKASVVAVEPIDLAALGYRGPAWQVFAKDRASSRIYRFGYQDKRSCGNMDGIGHGDYVEIEPGAEKDTGFTVSAETQVLALPKGSFDVFVSYRFCGFPVPSPLLGSPTQQSDILRDDAAQGRVASNVVTVEVE